MNHVNLIGKLNSAPKIVELSTGRKIAQFTLTTSETILNADGSAKNRSSWHRITAWGKWVKVLEEFGNAGIELAVEGKLLTRFYSNKGKTYAISEVEVNDLIILS